MATKRFLAPLCVLLAVAPVAGAPPPPPIVPEAFRGSFDGYELEPLYQFWRSWIEAQKGPVTDKLLAEPEILPGEATFGAPLLKYFVFNDFGHAVTADLRAYCRPAKPYGFQKNSCHYRFRAAFVAAAAAVFGAESENPVSLWMRDSFEPARLTRHLREAGLGPDTRWWTVDLTPIFAALSSPAAVLAENAEVVHVDSRDCVAMADAIVALEARRLGWHVDLFTVGKDAELHGSPAHASRFVYWLRIRTPQGSQATIEDDGRGVGRLVAPIIAAAQACHAPRAR
jgi:hypothetical protein